MLDLGADTGTASALGLLLFALIYAGSRLLQITTTKGREERKKSARLSASEGYNLDLLRQLRQNGIRPVAPPTELKYLFATDDTPKAERPAWFDDWLEKDKPDD